VEVVVVVPVKPLSLAKSRLRAAFGPGTDGLALAMALDVVAAASAAEAVDDVAVVTNDALVVAGTGAFGAQTIPDEPELGLNAALSSAAEYLRTERRGLGLIIQPADCPSVTPDDFDSISDALSAATRCLFVADRARRGTTTLAAPPALPLAPRYGQNSRSDHAATGAEELRGSRWQRLSTDVDTPDDLAAARRLGLGPHSRDWVDRMGR
jgi:2-phospho-L-lactate guanylyltransferase